MKGKSYLSVGAFRWASLAPSSTITSLNLAGDEGRAVDMTELRRRIDQKIYDEVELEMALARADKNFRYGEDQNAQHYKRDEEQSRAVLKESLLMAMCIRDMMQGNEKLAEKGLVEESLGYNAIAAGFGASATGPINTRTVTPPRRCSTAPSTGTACVSLCRRHRERQPQRGSDADGPPVDRYRAGVCRRAHLLVAGCG